MAFNVGRLAGHLGPPDPGVSFTIGQVTAVTGGVVTVAVLGDTVQAPYLGTAPAVNDTVAVLLNQGSALILGTLHGIPTF